ncbi:hypothetical protein LINPERHAP1_LOCUS2209 [Linum perenne]
MFTERVIMQQIFLLM